MKSRITLIWGLGLCLTVVPFSGGCLRAGSETATNAGGAIELEESPNSLTPSSDEAALAAAATNAPAIDISEAEVRPIAEDKPLPTGVRSAGPAGDLLKLAGSGVEENVILAYITNSPSVFNLSADEIIYLKDLGISGEVIAATLHKDQQLKAAGVVMPEQAPVQAQTDAGITTNWIGSGQIDPSQVAPQATNPPMEEGPPATAEAVPAPAPQPEVSYSTFYSSLSPYGTWLEVDGYGRVWQPTVVVVNQNWSPYFDGGRWIYTDHGWYWASDYSWGWAPFHYGRWFRHHRIGWCWAPDLVWGPSWVSWRYNDAYCGWAPLPPAAYYRPGFGFSYYGTRVGFDFGFGLSHHHYSFVEWRHFHHHHRNHLHAVPRHRAHDVYNNTRVVTKIVGNNNTVINEGISAQRVSSRTGTPVRKVAIREVNSRPENARLGRAERLDPARRTLTVYKPEAPKGERTGGIPMERVRSGFARSTSDPGVARERNGSPSRGGMQAASGTRPERMQRSTDRTADTARPPSTSDPARMARPTSPENGNARMPRQGVENVERRGTAEAMGRNPQPAPTGQAQAPAAQPGSEAQNRRSSGTPPLILRGPQSQPKSDSATTVERRSTPVRSGNELRGVGPTERPGSENVTPTERPTVQRPATAPAPRTGSERPAVARSLAPQTPAMQRPSSPVPAPQPSITPAPRAAETPSRPSPSMRSTAPAPAPTVRPSTPSPNMVRPSTAPAPGSSRAPVRVDRAPASRPAPAPGRQSAVWSSPRVPQTPSVQSQPAAAPSSGTVLGGYSAPTGQRPYTAPTGQRPYTAPTGQRSYSAPTAQQPYSAPTAQRQYSAPTGQRPYSASSATYTAPTRPSSGPTIAQRPSSSPSMSFSTAPSRPSPSFSAPRSSVGSGSRMSSAAPRSAPAASPGGSGGGGGFRGGGRGNR